MDIITRGDWDGLVSSVLLTVVEDIKKIKFVHPKDLQDGLIEVTSNDVLANVPYVPGCGLWFDHHSSEMGRRETGGNQICKGSCKIVPSCARVIYDYYGGPDIFSKFDEKGMMDAVDKSDSGQLNIEEIMRPEGWVLISYLMDPRTGLGYHKDFRISNYALMADLIQYCRTMPADHILQLPDVRERVDRYFAQEDAYQKMLKRCSRKSGYRPMPDRGGLSRNREGIGGGHHGGLGSN